jgi:hypothetical protein
MSKRREQEAVCIYKINEGIEEALVESKATSTVRGNHCAWCGDPPDIFGSHGICVSHAEQLIEQAAARRRARSLLLAMKEKPAGGCRVEKPIPTYLEPVAVQHMR